MSSQAQVLLPFTLEPVTFQWLSTSVLHRFLVFSKELSGQVLLCSILESCTFQRALRQTTPPFYSCSLSFPKSYRIALQNLGKLGAITLLILLRAINNLPELIPGVKLTIHSPTSKARPGPIYSGASEVVASPFVYMMMVRLAL